MSTPKTITRNGWTWTRDIGLWWGVSPTDERHTVSRPVMSSPWWIIGDPDPLAENPGYVYPDGAVTPLFTSSSHAMQHVVATYRAPLTVKASVGFEVWERDLSTEETQRWDGTPSHGFTLEAAVAKSEAFNEAQVWLDRYELAPTREFFVVKTTTTYETYTPDSAA